MTFLEKLRCIFTFGRGVALPLPEIDDNQSPTDLFSQWFNDAQGSGILLPEALSISTVNPSGCPSSRMVLLKSFSPTGFVFYTNYNSRKSQDLSTNPNIAGLFHWPVLQRQVRIEGRVEKVSVQESADYFKSRDRGSQIGAWASIQSAEMADESELKDRVKFYQEKFFGQDVPLPEFWGGWRIIPHRIEFWQGRASRLHDRIVFTKNTQSWDINRIYP